MNLKVTFWITFVLSAFLFFTPLPIEERVGLGLDKLVHLGLFAVMTTLGLRAYSNKRIRIILCLLIYTLLTELIQEQYIPHRHFDKYDIVADSLGIIVANMLYSN